MALPNKIKVTQTVIFTKKRLNKKMIRPEPKLGKTLYSTVVAEMRINTLQLEAEARYDSLCLKALTEPN